MDNIPCDPRLPLSYKESPSVTTTPTLSYGPKCIRCRILATLGILFLSLFPVISETYFRCAICGMRHTKWRIMGFGLPLHSWKQSTHSSDWYQANIEPKHQHVWVQTGYMEGKTFYGLKTFMLQDMRLSTGPFVYLPLGRTGQIRTYQKSPNPEQARNLFLRFARYEPSGSDAYKEQQELFTRFTEWRESYLEDPWPFEAQ